MNILERAEKAAELKKNGVCNCAQAVASVLADQTDLSEEELMKINAGFAVGMGNMEATCGALVSARRAEELSVRQSRCRCSSQRRQGLLSVKISREGTRRSSSARARTVCAMRCSYTVRR